MEADRKGLTLEMERLTEESCLASSPNSGSVILKPYGINKCGINKANEQVTLSSVTTKSFTKESYLSSNFKVTLENVSVWGRFHSLGTEMILTKQGRRMFPCCRFRMSGLDPQRKYFLVMEIMPLDDFTHKWNGKRWEPVAVDEPHVLGQISVHPESPALGQQWMDSPVSFYKVKLTSDPMDQEGCVLLRPMRRYLPRLHIVPVDPESEKTIALNGPNVKIFSFPQTEFYAVTSYQNPRITQLKIDCNPFAMAFREDTQSIRLLKDKLGLCSSVGAHFQSPLLSLAQDLSGKRKEGAVKSTESTCIENNRKRDFCPGSVSLKEGEGIFTKMRNDTLICPNKIALCQENTDCNKNNKHISPRDVEPCVTMALEETLSSTDEPSPAHSISSTENPKCSEDAVNFRISDSNSESPTHFSMPEIKPAASSPPNSPVPNGSQVHVHKPGLYRRKYNRRGRKAKAKCWSKAKYSKPLPAVLPHKSLLQPDLEDVDGMLFVSFVAKEALNIPDEKREESEQALPPPCPTHDQSDNHGSEDVSVKERITKLEKTLLRHLKQQKHRQIIHPCLQDVGMKLSLLDPNLAIDLQYLGVHLPLPPPIQEDLDQINPVKLSPSPDAAGLFVSRTGKTNDPTKIKGWKEKFQANTVQSAPESLKNSSAFCSEMLDAYLENEAQQISDRVAVFSKSSALPVSYQLPSKSSSYVVTLDSLLKARSVSANKIYSKPTSEILPKSPRRSSPSTAASLSSADFQQRLQGSRDTGRKYAHSYQAHQHVVTELPGRTSKRFVSRRRMWKQPGKSQLTWNSGAGKVRHIRRVQSPVINVRVKKGMMLQKMEEDAMIHGKVHTCITTDRANFALTSLFNFQKPCKRPKFPFQYRHKNACPKDFCLLGCICNSLAREIRGPTHCRRVECMFDCSCFKHKVLLHHPPKETANIQRGRKRSVLAFSIADPNKEPRPPPPPSITTLWKRTAGNDDPEPLFVPSSPFFSKNVSHLHSSLSHFTSQVREEDKDFVYLFFESMMTCARVREYNSNPPPQIHMFPTKREMRDPEQLNEIADANESPSQKTPETNPAETPLNPAEPKPIKLLEILSECNWEPHRNLVLNALFRHMNSNHLSEPFCIETYKIRLLSTTFKGANRSSTIMYKVCVSRADENAMTHNLQVPVKKTLRKQCSNKGFENKGSEITETQNQKADTGSGQMRSATVEMQQNMSPHKKLLSHLPSLTHSAHAGHLRAVKSKSGIHPKGLIKVNGKMYNNTKLLLGKVGALHPVNRFAGFTTGKALPVPQDQEKSVGEQDKACPPKAPLKPSSVKEVSNVSKQTPSNRVAAGPPLANEHGPNPAFTNNRSNTSQLNAVPKLVGKPPVVPDGSRFLLVPVTPPNFVAAPSSETVSSSTLPPGQQVVLKPAPGMPGSHFICQYNGQMIQLKPLSSRPLARIQPKSVNEGSSLQTANTILPKDTKSLHEPLKSTPQILPQNCPVVAPKVHTLSAKNAINIANGTPTLNLQSSFPGKTGTFSFRICPPTSETKPVGLEHGGKPPETCVDSPTVVLPGGFTLIKLIDPAVPTVPTKFPLAASHPSEVSQSGESIMTSLSSSPSHEQNCEVSERISSAFLPSTCNSAPQHTADLSQSGNGFPLEIVIKNEHVEHCSVNSETPGKFNWVRKDSEMVLESISKLEHKDMDDWPLGKAERLLWMDSEEEEENKRLNKAPRNLDAALERSSAEETREDACSKSSCVDDQSRSGMSNHDPENVCGLFVNGANLNTADTNKQDQTYNKKVTNGKQSQMYFGSGNCPPVVIKNEPCGEPPETDMAGNKLDFKIQGQVGNRTSSIRKIKGRRNQTGKNTLLKHFLTNEQRLVSDDNCSLSIKIESCYDSPKTDTPSLHDEVFKYSIGSDDILPVVYKDETSLDRRMQKLSSDLNNQDLGSENSFQGLNHNEMYSSVNTFSSPHSGDSHENIGVAGISPCSLLNCQTPVNSLSTALLLKTAPLHQKPFSPSIYNVQKYSSELSDILGNLSDNSTKISINVQHDLKEKKGEIMDKTERFKPNKDLGELREDEDIIVDVINLSENEDDGLIDKFDQDMDTSSDDSEDDSESDEEDSSNDSTSDSESSESVGMSSEDNVDIESFEDSDVKRIMNVMKSQTRHKIDTKTAAKFTEQHCTSVFSTSICDEEKRLNHTEKERLRRDEMRQQFSALQKALNVDERVRMCKHDILNQAQHVIRTLEDQARYLEIIKKYLCQKQSAYLSRISVLSGKAEKTVSRDKVHFYVNCKQQKWPESTNSLQSSPPGPFVSRRRLDSDGNRLPPRLGCWKAPNYIRKRSRKALLQPSITTTEKSLDTSSSPDTQGSQSVSIPMTLGKTENLVRTLISENPNGLPSLRKTPQQKSLSEPKGTERKIEERLLPKIELQSFAKTDAEKLKHAVKTPPPSSTNTSDTAELRNDCNLDLQNQNKEVEIYNPTRDANMVENTVSEHSNKESPTSTTSVIESEVKNNTSPELKSDAQASVAEVKMRRKRVKYDVLIEEALSNPEVLEPRQLRKRTPVVGRATRGGLTKKRRRII